MKNEFSSDAVVVIINNIITFYFHAKANELNAIVKL